MGSTTAALGSRFVVDRSFIQVKALAFLPNAAGTHHLVFRGCNAATGEEFHRFLGGGVEVLERSEDAVVREIGEELGATLVQPRLLGVLENIIEYADGPGHQVAFIYAGRLAEGDVVPPEGGTYYDLDVPIRVEWRPLDETAADIPLRPVGAAELIARA